VVATGGKRWQIGKPRACVGVEEVDGNVFLTAAHCVEGAEPPDLFVKAPDAPCGPREVVEVRRHPIADIALLKLAENCWLGGVEPFVDRGDSPGLGADFMAYGFPEDYPDA
jgi:hypothetical protein